MCRGWHRLWPGLRRHRRLQPLIRLCCALWQVTLLLLLCCTLPCMRLLPCISRNRTIAFCGKGFNESN